MRRDTARARSRGRRPRGAVEPVRRRRASGRACAAREHSSRERSGARRAAAEERGRRPPSRRRRSRRSRRPLGRPRSGKRPRHRRARPAPRRRPAPAAGRFHAASHERSVVSSSIPAESTSCGRSCWRRTPATIATVSSWSGSSSRSRKSGSQTTSLLISTTTSVSAASTPRLMARPKPVFSGSRTKRVRGNRSASSSIVPSVEALSTTTTSCSTVWRPSPSSASASSRHPLKVGMTTVACT